MQSGFRTWCADHLPSILIDVVLQFLKDAEMKYVCNAELTLCELPELEHDNICFAYLQTHWNHFISAVPSDCKTLWVYVKEHDEWRSSNGRIDYYALSRLQHYAGAHANKDMCCWLSKISANCHFAMGAIGARNLAFLEWLLERFPGILNYECFNNAVRVGDILILAYLLRANCYRFPPSLWEIAANQNNLQVLEWLWNNIHSPPAYVPGTQFNLETVIWFASKTIGLTENAFRLAVCRKSIDIPLLEYLYAQKYRISENALVIAIQNQNDAVHWLHAHGCPWPPNMDWHCITLKTKNAIEMLQWAYAHGYEFREVAISFAIERSNIQALELFVSLQFCTFQQIAKWAICDLALCQTSNFGFDVLTWVSTKMFLDKREFTDFTIAQFQKSAHPEKAQAVINVFA